MQPACTRLACRCTLFVRCQNTAFSLLTTLSSSRRSMPTRVEACMKANLQLADPAARRHGLAWARLAEWTCYDGLMRCFRPSPLSALLALPLPYCRQPDNLMCAWCLHSFDNSTISWLQIHRTTLSMTELVYWRLVCGTHRLKA